MIEISWLAMVLLATQDEIYSKELASNEEQTLRYVKRRQNHPENMWIPNRNIFPIFRFLFWHTAWNPVLKKLIETTS
jgi:hypothetical protein